MKKYGGQLIYSTHDEYGPIEVVDIGQRIRSLHFGNTTQQSSMFMFNPVVLMHKYTQAMLTSLCWHKPKTALVLGLGAGAISKYLLHFFPTLHVDAVELRPAVSVIAREYFSLPEVNDRFNIHHMPAEEFLRSSSPDTSQYDVILVDLFLTTKEQDINVDISTVIAHLKRLLSEHGSMSINLIGMDYKAYSGFSQLKDEFDEFLYAIAVDSSNTVLLARHKRTPDVTESVDFTSLEKRLGLPFRQYFNKLQAI